MTKQEKECNKDFDWLKEELGNRAKGCVNSDKDALYRSGRYDALIEVIELLEGEPAKGRSD